MQGRKSQKKRTVTFKRRSLKLLPPSSGSPNLQGSLALRSRAAPPPTGNEMLPVAHPRAQECTVLVINSGHELAKEITLQLTLAIPGCGIMYAPTIELAKWLLKRRKIDLVVSSPVLADGGINRLDPVLSRLPVPPDIVVVADSVSAHSDLLQATRYHFVSLHALGGRSAKLLQRGAGGEHKSSADSHSVRQNISALGADIRNDLNNPLQEIVAMVFVARSGADTSAPIKQALQAIDRAAQNMAKLVNGLEEKIMKAVKS